MDNIFDFNTFLSQTPDLKTMDKSQLLERLEQLRALVAQLDEAEPADMDSEEYEEWGEQHEELEDLIDDVLDRLEDLKEANGLPSAAGIHETVQAKPQNAAWLLSFFPPYSGTIHRPTPLGPAGK